MRTSIGCETRKRTIRGKGKKALRKGVREMSKGLRLGVNRINVI